MAANPPAAPERSGPGKRSSRTAHREPEPSNFRTLTIYFDGASRGNPGPAAIGVVISEPGGKTVRELSEYVGRATNNYAEYAALIRGLEEAKRLGASEVKCYSDSELVVRQMTGEYRVRSKNLLPLIQRAQSLRRGFEKFSLKHVERSKNARADELAGKALKEKQKG